MTLAAFDLQHTNEKIIDIASTYDYQLPDSFARAFQKLHGITPTQAREKNIPLKAYPRVRFSITVEGREAMKYKIVEKEAFQIAGFKKNLSIETLMNGVGEMWQSMTPEKMAELTTFNKDTTTSVPMGAYSKIYEDYSTDYFVAVITDGTANTKLETLDVPAATWAIFECNGALPLAIGEMFQRIYNEWFPISGYEQIPLPEFEWYSEGDMSSEEYRCEIWIPIVKQFVNQSVWSRLRRGMRVSTDISCK